MTRFVLRARLFLILARPALLFLLALSAALGVASAGHALDVAPLVRTLLVVVPFVACAVALNDVSDVAVDRINLAGDRTRPLVTRSADERAMHAIAAFGAIGAVVAAATLGWAAVLVVGLGLGLAAAHSLPPARLSGRGILGPLVLPFGFVAVPFLVGVAAAAGSLTGTTVGLLAALYVGFVGRLLLKDFRDMRGDALLGKRTFLVRRGRVTTCALSAVFWVASSAALVVVPELSASLVLAWSVLLGVALVLLVRLARSRSPRLDERLIAATAAVGRGLLLVLLAHLGLVQLGAGAARSASTLGLVVGVVLVWAADLVRRDAVVIGPAIVGSGRRPGAGTQASQRVA